MKQGPTNRERRAMDTKELHQRRRTSFDVCTEEREQIDTKGKGRGGKGERLNKATRLQFLGADPKGGLAMNASCGLIEIEAVEPLIERTMTVA